MHTILISIYTHLRGAFYILRVRAHCKTVSSRLDYFTILRVIKVAHALHLILINQYIYTLVHTRYPFGERTSCRRLDFHILLSYTGPIWRAKGSLVFLGGFCVEVVVVYGWWIHSGVYSAKQSNPPLFVVRNKAGAPALLMPTFLRRLDLRGVRH